MGRAIGIIANPAAGKDVRRLVARASLFDNREKGAIVRRLVAGAVAAGAREFVYLPDRHGIAASALHGCADVVELRPLAIDCEGTWQDTVAASRRMRDEGCAVLVTLGGDGTNRAVVLGWREAPLLPIATGTNCVFPRPVEATLAGAAAGLAATGAVRLDEVSGRAKLIHVEIEGCVDDVALIDAVLVGGRFTGARAIWDPVLFRVAVLARAEPTAVGVTSIGGLLDPVAAADEAGLLLEFGPGGRRVIAPVMPGAFREVAVARTRRLALGERIEIEGPGVLALDGERERVLRPGQRAHLRVCRDGPRVIDVDRVLADAARRGLFVRAAADGSAEADTTATGHGAAAGAAAGGSRAE